MISTQRVNTSDELRYFTTEWNEGCNAWHDIGIVAKAMAQRIHRHYPQHYHNKKLVIWINLLIFVAMNGFRAINNKAIVLIFAVLHFGVSMLSRVLDYYDDIPLTILTITMVIVVSMRNNTRVEIMAVLTLVVTLLGFIFGSWLWEPMMHVVNDSYLAPAISTFIITTILGLATDHITMRVKRIQSNNKRQSITPRNIIIVAISILILRMVYVAMDRAEIFTEGMLLTNMMDVMGNSWALLLLLAGNIILTLTISRHSTKDNKKAKITTLALAISTLAIPALSAALIYFDAPYFSNPGDSLEEFVRTLSAALLIDLIIITVCYMIQAAMESHRALREEREMKHRTEYQYERLKQQINPHFLFNSLGILDYLVQEHETERASAFIRKLAGTYRYMLSNDNKPLVKLSEEIEFTTKYIDLLKERFIEGMVVEWDIDKSLLNKMVVPCALQLLVENATKHNIVSGDTPLRINIATEGDRLVVRNNLQLRTHGQPSTHLGLANIRRQYLDITGHEISVVKSDREFIVKLPIV